MWTINAEACMEINKDNLEFLMEDETENLRVLPRHYMNPIDQRFDFHVPMLVSKRWAQLARNQIQEAYILHLWRAPKGISNFLLVEEGSLISNLFRDICGMQFDFRRENHEKDLLY